MNGRLTERLILISADGHAEPRAGDIRGYLDPKFRDDFDDWLSPGLKVDPGRRRQIPKREVVPDHEVTFAESERVRTGGEDGYYDFHRRIKELELDGIVGEVIFPNMLIPFGFGFSDESSVIDFFGAAPAGKTSTSKEQKEAGCRAWNRWLASQIASHPGRLTGPALINVYSIRTAVQDIEAAYADGVRGGVILPDGQRGDEVPLYNGESYEPIWEICEGLDLPICNHPGVTGNPWSVPGPGGRRISDFERSYWRPKRQFLSLFLGGVFERHPRLKWAVTENGVDWIPGMLASLDARYFGGINPRPAFQHSRHPRGTGFSGLAADLETPAAEVWKRQCWGGASFMPKDEAEMRHTIGVDRIMWGADYPHPEGTWPHTAQWLQKTFDGIAENEVRLMVGENVLSCYSTGFDYSALSEAAERVGPDVSEIVGVSENAS